MATLVLSAAGAAAGSSIGGSVLGLSMTAVGRFIGASVGRRIDARLLGQGADPVETGRIDRYRVTGAGEGTRVPQVFGRMRLGGHVIWASRYRETVTEQRTGGGGGKGAPAPQSTIKSYSYSVSLALAVCEGEITSVGRVWADGAEIATTGLDMRVYRGTHDQLPDPAIEAVEGAGNAPAYRGTAYVVIEELQLGRFGNRVPQFSFEVTRPELADETDVPRAVRAVAVIPGTGEYAYATRPVSMGHGLSAQIASGAAKVANVNGASSEPDFKASMRALKEEVPDCAATSLIVAWFGDDLRCGQCSIRPKVEQSEQDSAAMPWSVSGLSRASALSVPQDEGRPMYGGTPCDTSVVQAIRKMRDDDGLDVMVYPFILMDQVGGNGLADPWSGTGEQAELPWRGRITLSLAPGLAGSPDGTSAADTQVANFFGSARASHFQVSEGEVTYTGPAEWSYRRFILHHAALCAAAGGVDSFCIGSEMRGLTQIRGASGFPAVAALRALAGECRALLGANVKIGYAADWSEYFGYQPLDGSGDVFFHLDPLWADPDIDFVGIDNYMPLSDWREGDDHADAHHGAIYDLDYLRGNIEGGEGYDWYYASHEDRLNQVRSPITDGVYGEPWVWRYKDIRNWWDNAHHNRIGGVREASATDWAPRSKPIWFTELGCAAIDKGTNQPNKFLDPKSSESRLPFFSTGLRDDFIQRQYLRATFSHWAEAENNPVSEHYGGPMLDMSRAFVWTWDARPYPWFPGNGAVWSDGPNYRRGHWLNGRVSSRSLESVVREICHKAGLTTIDTSELYGTVRGYVLDQGGDARQALQPLMLAHGFDAVERDGTLVFRSRQGYGAVALGAEDMVAGDDNQGALEVIRSGEADLAGRVGVSFAESDGDHQIVGEEATLAGDGLKASSATDLAMSLTRNEGRQIAERWLTEARVARETLRFTLPLSRISLGAGDLVDVEGPDGAIRARVDRVDVTDRQSIEAVRVHPSVYRPTALRDDTVRMAPVVARAPVTPVFLDLPLLSGDEIAHAPYIAVSARPWPGEVALYDGAEDADYRFNMALEAPSIMGLTQTPMYRADPGRPDLGAELDVALTGGTLQSISEAALLSGANLMAIGDGSSDVWEVFQFRDATLINPNTWRLGHRLRGQAGTDGIMPEVWPSGSTVVRLNGLPVQIGLGAAARGVERHYRVGPSDKGYAHDSYVHRVETFDGIGLRPYRPVHLRAARAGLDLDLSWVRRSRVGGDSWTGLDVPLGEAQEQYLVRIVQLGTVLREVVVGSQAWQYTHALQLADGASGSVSMAVAQVSDQFGPGPFAQIEVLLP